MRSPRYGYIVGSPAREMATCLGSWASLHMAGGQRGSPLKPEASRLCPSMHVSSTASGSCHLATLDSNPRTRQQNRQLCVQSFTTGVI